MTPDTNPPLVDDGRQLQELVEQLQAELRAARCAIDASAQRLHTLFRHAPEAIVMLDVDSGRFVDANPEAERLFGMSLEELLQVGPFQLSPPFQPEGPSAEVGRRKIAAATDGEEPVFQWWHCNADGETFPCEVRLERIPWGQGEVLRGSVADVSDKRLLEISEAVRRRVLDDIASGVCWSTTLAALANAVEQLLPGTLCSILLLDPESQTLSVVAAPSLPDFYNAAVEGLKIGPNIGSCGAAAYSGRRVIASDTSTHPNWQAFQEIAERAELRACWSEPIRSFTGTVLGTFAMYHRHPSVPSAVELKAIEIAAQLTAIALEHERMQQSQRDMQETLQLRVAEKTKNLSAANRRLRNAETDLRLAAVAFDTHDSIVITDQRGKILRVNRSFTELTGFLPADVIGKTPRVLKSGLHGEDFYRKMWRCIRSDGYWQGEVWNRRKDGSIYLQRLTIAAVKNELGETTHYVGDGQDLTLVKQAESDRAAIHAARIVQEALFPADPPCLPGFDIAASMLPAERVSGDFYDYLSLGEHSVGVVVADVSGHGFAPALLMAQTQAYLRAIAESGSEASSGTAGLLTRVNRLFSLRDSGRFVTMFLGHLDSTTRRFTYTGAGHRGFKVRCDGTAQELKSTDFPLGVEESAVFSQATVDMRPGEILVVPTDGFEEALRPDGNMLGHKGMLEVVRNNRHTSAAEIVAALFSEAREYTQGRPQVDDMTVLVIKAAPQGDP